MGGHSSLLGAAAALGLGLFLAPWESLLTDADALSTLLEIPDTPLPWRNGPSSHTASASGDITVVVLGTSLVLRAERYHNTRRREQIRNANPQQQQDPQLQLEPQPQRRLVFPSTDLMRRMLACGQALEDLQGRVGHVFLSGGRDFVSSDWQHLIYTGNSTGQQLLHADPTVKSRPESREKITTMRELPLFPSEAEVMEQALHYILLKYNATKGALPPIVLENDSTSTYTNALFVRQILEEEETLAAQKNLDRRTVKHQDRMVVITSGFHQFRSRRVFEKAFAHTRILMYDSEEGLKKLSAKMKQREGLKKLSAEMKQREAQHQVAAKRHGIDGRAQHGLAERESAVDDPLSSELELILRDALASGWPLRLYLKYMSLREVAANFHYWLEGQM